VPHVERAALDHPEERVRISNLEFALEVTHRGAPIAAATRLVKHQVSAMQCPKLVNQIRGCLGTGDERDAHEIKKIRAPSGCS
jgi:hypothetical protein